MRPFADRDRASMKEETFEAEWTIRVNKRLLAGKMEAAFERV